ncbi:MAG: fumarate hydratase [Actinobacteria bacterium]|nr:fumarate hydratase [Actinomycetota bacterium]
MSPTFGYEDLLPLGKDDTKYRNLGSAGVTTVKHGDKTFLEVSAEAITALSETALHDINHYLRSAHLQQLANILKDPESSPNDRFVALDLLKNANIAAGGILPMCQDTGTAIVMGKKGQSVLTSSKDERAIAQGIYNAYTKLNLRYSQMAPITMWEEKNTGNNLPAQIELYADTDHPDEYSFLFIAKGGGSANKSFLYQETKSVLNPDTFYAWVADKLRSIGTAACPPYHLAIVIGGTSAEHNVKTAKLASTKYLDSLPTSGDPATGHGFRDLEVEEEVLKLTRTLGIGAQFGGKYFCHDVRVIRLPRHGASVPISIAVSCSADRQAKAKITKDGIFIEDLERDPAHFLPDTTEAHLIETDANMVSIDLNQGMEKVLEQLRKCPVKTRLSLTGTLVVARDLAHARIRTAMEAGEPMPSYLRDYAVYYAGPAKTPEGYASGSFGPTTAGRMDSYVNYFQSHGGSMVMLAKGNRSKAVTDSCKEFGGFYLGSIGGPAARLAQDCIKKVEVLDFEELGMEAVWKIDVVDFPAFVVIDNKGNDFFAETLRPMTIGKVGSV